MVKQLVYTPLSEIPKIHDALLSSFKAGKTQSIAFRKKQIARLGYMVRENEEAFHTALYEDLHRSGVETVLGEFSPILHEVVETYNHIDEWTKDIKPPTTATYQVMRPRIKPSPKGIVLIIAPFNYPLNLSLTPLISAIAAGNTVVIKFSESLPTVSPLVEELIAKYLDPDVVRVVQGAVDEVNELLKLEWNHIFFTGSTKVGKIIATAAAKFITPVTLELGGKCPIIVDPRKADFKVIARRILWGRTSNSGQVCVCPDYVLIPRTHQRQLVDALKEVYVEFYPGGPQTSDSFGRLVNSGSVKRITGYLEGSKGDVVLGGLTNASKDGDPKYLPPTVVANVLGDDATMQEEMFGPVISIVPIDSLDDAIKFINDRPQPLALYVFSHDSEFKKKVTRSTRSGAIDFNDTMTHAIAAGLAFGGSGNSGYGQYHGKYGFDTFTHYRSSLETPTWAEAVLSFRYPPFPSWKLKMAEMSLLPSRFPFDKNGKKTLLSRIQSFLPMFLVIVLAYYYRRDIRARSPIKF